MISFQEMRAGMVMLNKDMVKFFRVARALQRGPPENFKN